MLYVERSVVVVALLLSACEFPAPGARPTDPDAGGGADGAGPGPDPQAWLHPWARRKAITLRASQIEAPGDGALADFPVLVSVADPQIRASALASGGDIVFTAGDAVTVLASELESFTPAQGDPLIAWVKVPSLPATTDTTLYVYYGNPGPPAPTPEAVWTANYLAVWHLHQDPGPDTPAQMLDATSGNRDGTASAAMERDDSVRGPIGRALDFNGSDEYVDYASLDFGDRFTISMWASFEGGTNVKTLMSSSTVGGDTDGFRFFINSAGSIDRRILFETGNGTVGSVNRAQTNSNAIPLNTPTHVAAVVDRTAGTALIYVNGVSVATDTSIRNDFRTSSDFELARMEDSGYHLPGTLDEVRVAGALRSPEWIRTQFNNQSRPGDFHVLGPEQLRP